ncbi:MAG: heme exporter protein CcmD [Halocynthiibacter sp.]
MPDLGKYADAVLSSYAVTIALLAILIGLSLLRNKKMREKLCQIERKKNENA